MDEPKITNTWARNKRIDGLGLSLDQGRRASIMIKAIGRRQGRQAADRFIGLVLIKIALIGRWLPGFSRSDSSANSCLLLFNKIVESSYIEIDSP